MPARRRSRSYNAEVLVLRRRNVGEADSILTVLSPEEGRFQVIARGLRKAKSRAGGHLEPFSRTKVLLAHGRTYDVVAQAELIDPFRALREDLDLGAAAAYACELLEGFAAERMAQPELYDLALLLMESLQAGAPVAVMRWFEVHLLALAGYDLQLDACATCSDALPERETLLAPDAGGLVCESCRARSLGGRIASVRAIKVLRFARQASLSQFAALRLEGDLAAEVQGLMAIVVRSLLERELQTPRYVEEVKRLSPARQPVRGDGVE